MHALLLCSYIDGVNPRYEKHLLQQEAHVTHLKEVIPNLHSSGLMCAFVLDGWWWCGQDRGSTILRRRQNDVPTDTSASSARRMRLVAEWICPGRCINDRWGKALLSVGSQVWAAVELRQQFSAHVHGTPWPWWTLLMNTPIISTQGCTCSHEYSFRRSRECEPACKLHWILWAVTAVNVHMPVGDTFAKSPCSPSTRLMWHQLGFGMQTNHSPRLPARVSCA